MKKEPNAPKIEFVLPGVTGDKRSAREIFNPAFSDKAKKRIRKKAKQG